MSAAHTAGPWRVGDAGATVFGPPTGDPLKMSRVVARTNVGPLAAVESMANARLIAAAPTLLDALKGLLSWLEDGTPEDCRSDEENACIRDGRAALAAAEGGGK